ncbi:MAG: cell wall anchor protein, partial [Candidatus Saccharibacteria bacterium]|nr:cell wall anchor protein [Candidatus Saccharibacteria bacterium]
VNKPVSTATQTALNLKLTASNNLSDVASAATARTNLGLGTAATQNKVAAGSAGVLDATDSTTTNSRTPSGTAGGDLIGTYPNPTLKNTGTAGSYGDSTHFPILTTDAQGRVTTVTTQVTPSGADQLGLTRTAVKTTSYTAVAGDLIPVDTTSGAVTITLPAAAAGVVVAIKHIVQGGSNAVTINRAGSDVFNKTGGSTSLSLSLINQGVLLQGTAGIWTVVADDMPLSVLDSRYTPLGVPAWVALTVYVGGQLAVDPSGNLIVRISAGTARASYDATEQALWFTPGASSAPTGPAGGFLTGSYPNPGGPSGLITDSMVAAGAAIAPTKLALVNDGAWTSPTQRSGSALRQSRRRVNRWYNPPGAPRGSNTVAIAGGLMYLVPVHIERPLSISDMSMEFIGAAAGGQIRFGIYLDDGQGEPTGAPVIDSGLKTAPTTINTFTTAAFGSPYVITNADQYWLALLVCNNVTGTPSAFPYSPSHEGIGSPAQLSNVAFVSGLTTTLPTLSGASLTYFSAEFWPMVAYKISAYT